MTPLPTDEDNLRTILIDNVGMSQYEAEVYLALIRSGKQSMNKLATTSGVPKQRIYDTVTSLQENGFVEVTDEYPQKAFAIDPYEAILPVQRQLNDAKKRLEEIHQTADDGAERIQLFKNKQTIHEYTKKIISSAETSLFVLCPLDMLHGIHDELSTQETISTRLILSDIDPKATTEDSIELEIDVSALADDIRGITSNEAFLVCADRRRAFYWTSGTELDTADENHGFYVVNPDLALLFDRFLSDSLWPFARPLNDSIDESPSFPREYVRLRDCLADLKRVSDRRLVSSFHVVVDGYDTRTGERVQLSGVLDGYYFTEYDVRAYLNIRLDPEHDSATETETVSVGGWGTNEEDYEMRKITVRERSQAGRSPPLDTETTRYLEKCRTAIRDGLSVGSVVLGFDADVDRVRKLVAERDGPTQTTDMAELASFRELLFNSEATGTAPTVEWVQTETRPGGHTIHAASVLDRVGAELTLIGPFGDPVQAEFGNRFNESELLSLGTPSDTDYVIFSDGKLLLTETNSQTEVNWDTIIETIGREELIDRLNGANTLDAGTWADIPSLPFILEQLYDEIWPKLEEQPTEIVVTLGNVNRLAEERIRTDIEVFSRIDETVGCTLIGNRDQTEQLIGVLGREPESRSLKHLVKVAREQANVSRYVANTLDTAAVATEGGVAEAAAPVHSAEKLPTNADDHFSAGYMLALSANVPASAALIIAHSVASYFMEYEEEPTVSEIESCVSSYEMDRVIPQHETRD